MRSARILLTAAAAVLAAGLAVPALADDQSPSPSPSVSSSPSPSPSASTASDPAVSISATFHPSSARPDDVVELDIQATRHSGGGVGGLSVPMDVSPLTFIDVNFDVGTECGETGPPGYLICRLPSRVDQWAGYSVYYRVGDVSGPGRVTVPLTANVGGETTTTSVTLPLSPAPSGSPSPPPSHTGWYVIKARYDPASARPGEAVELIVTVTGLRESGYVLIDIDVPGLSYRGECVGDGCGTDELDYPGTLYCRAAGVKLPLADRRHRCRTARRWQHAAAGRAAAPSAGAGRRIGRR